MTPPPQHWPELVLAAEVGLAALIAAFQTMTVPGGGLSLFLFYFGLYGALVFAPIHLWVKIRYADRIKTAQAGQTRLTVMPRGEDLDPEHRDAEFQRFYWQQMRAPWLFVGTTLLSLAANVVLHLFGLAPK